MSKSNDARSLFETLESRTLFAAAPQLTLLWADNRGQVILQADKDLLGSSVTNTSVQILTAGNDATFGTNDDAVVASTATYNTLTRQITVTRNGDGTGTPEEQQRELADILYRVRVRSSLVTGTDGLQIDGEYNGRGLKSGNNSPGGDFDVRFALKSTPLLRFQTILGNIDMTFYSEMVNTIANFKKYADDGLLDKTIIHRKFNSLGNPPFQGAQAGEFRITGPSSYEEIPAPYGVNNEQGRTNKRGSVGMGKIGGQPNSATNNFFFNSIDNGPAFDAPGNDGYNVFGEVTPASLAVLDAIIAKQVYANQFFGNETPVLDLDAVNNRGFLTVDDLVTFSRVSFQVDDLAINSLEMVGVGDFNGDTRPDIVYRDLNTGANQVWFMQGTNRTGIGNLPAGTDPSWKIFGTGNFNGDPFPDILWRNIVTGEIAIWLMQGISIQSVFSMGVNSNLNEMPIVGDLNNDGKSDLIWRDYTTGGNRVWFLDTVYVVGSANLLSIPNANWRVQASADFNSDNKQDLVWRNLATGGTALWLMDGITRTQSLSITSAAGTWNVAGAADVDGDGFIDLFWQNLPRPAGAIWLMGGTSRAASMSLPNI